jgi:uncharacterized membrane protein YgcG
MRILVGLFSLFLATNAFGASFVQDEGNLLSPSEQSNLTQELANIQSRTGVFVAARTINGLGSQSINDAAYNTRMMLERDYPSVVVMLVSWNDHKAFIGTSGVVKQSLPDSVVNNIFTNTMTPALRRKDISGAFSAAAREINTRLPELSVARAPNVVTTYPTQVAQHQNDSSYLGFLFLLIVCAGVIGLIFYAISRRRREYVTNERVVTSDYESYVPPVRTYSTHEHVHRTVERPSNNVFAPIIVNNETDHWSAPTREPSYVPDPSPTIVPSTGGGAGGSFDDGGGAGGSFDSGGGSGGSFDSSPSTPSSDWGSSSSSSDWGSSSSSSDSGGSFDSGSGGGFDSGGGSGGDF